MAEEIDSENARN